MATPYEIKLSPEKTPGTTHIPNLKQESADKISSLLMLNHKSYHTLFNDIGLHSKLPAPSYFHFADPRLTPQTTSSTTSYLYGRSEPLPPR